MTDSYHMRQDEGMGWQKKKKHYNYLCKGIMFLRFKNLIHYLSIYLKILSGYLDKNILYLLLILVLYDS